MYKIKNLLGAAAVLFTTNIAAADRFYTEAVNLVPGTDSMLEFYLDNSQEYIGFQAIISVPEGITMAKPTLSERANGTASTITFNPIGDNLVNVAVFSSMNVPYSGSEGILMYASIHVNEEFKGGQLTITDILFSNISKEDIPMEDCNVEIGVNLPTNNFYLPDFSIKPNETKKVALVLDNETPFKAFQTDILMPEGLSIVPESFMLTSRCDANVDYRTNNSGLTRVTVLANDPFSGNSGDLLSFEVMASPGITDPLQITISNNLFTANDNKEFILENSVTNVTVDTTTGIGSISDGIELSTIGNILHISGLSKDINGELYSTDGTLIQKIRSINSEISITLQYGQIYILKIGSSTFKLKL